MVVRGSELSSLLYCSPISLGRWEMAALPTEIARLQAFVALSEKFKLSRINCAGLQTRPAFGFHFNQLDFGFHFHQQRSQLSRR